MNEPVVTGEPRRDFVEYDHPEGLYTLEAHTVTADTEGQFPVAGGTYQDAREGDVVVRRGTVYEIHDADAWTALDLNATRDQEDLNPYVEPEAVSKTPDPSTMDAASVRRYLLSPNHTDEEKQTVARAEQDGKNRSSAFPKGFVVESDEPDYDADHEDPHPVL